MITLIQDNVRETDGVVGFDSSQPSVCTGYPLPSGIGCRIGQWHMGEIDYMLALSRGIRSLACFCLPS